jgi:hypothetical protein
MAVQAACQGGSFAVESVAAFAWNGWQASSGISGNLGLEYATPEFLTVLIWKIRHDKTEKGDHAMRRLCYTEDQ